MPITLDGTPAAGGIHARPDEQRWEEPPSITLHRVMCGEMQGQMVGGMQQ